MRNPRLLVPVFAATLAVLGCEPAVDVVVEAGDPLPGLSEGEMGRFLLGKALFSRITSLKRA